MLMTPGSFSGLPATSTVKGVWFSFRPLVLIESGSWRNAVQNVAMFLRASVVSVGTESAEICAGTAIATDGAAGAVTGVDAANAMAAMCNTGM